MFRESRKARGLSVVGCGEARTKENRFERFTALSTKGLISSTPRRFTVSGFPKKSSERQLRREDIGKRFSSRPKLDSIGTTARFRETPRPVASGRRSKIRSV